MIAERSSAIFAVGQMRQGQWKCELDVRPPVEMRKTWKDEFALFFTDSKQYKNTLIFTFDCRT